MSMQPTGVAAPEPADIDAARVITLASGTSEPVALHEVTLRK